MHNNQVGFSSLDLAKEENKKKDCIYHGVGSFWGDGVSGRRVHVDRYRCGLGVYLQNAHKVDDESFSAVLYDHDHAQ